MPSFDQPDPVVVDGVEYHADRFYLLRAEGDPEPGHGNTQTFGGGETVHNKSGCTCGAHGAPPLLDRQRLIESLDLKAVIIGTYTIDVPWAVENVPSLFGDDSESGPVSVPTLVLHGHKGLRLPAQDESDDDDDATNQKNSQSSQDDDDDEETVFDFIGSPIRKKLKREHWHSSDDEPETIPSRKTPDGVQEVVSIQETPPEEAWWSKEREQQEMDEDDSVAHEYSLPSYCHFTQVLPTWLPLTAPVQASWPCREDNDEGENASLDGHVIDLNSDDERETFQGLDPSIEKHRVSRRGVNHPKFLILFEKRGSVVVVVGTANFTRQTSVDGVWLQRFEPTTKKQRAAPLKIPNRHDGSDFGWVLANFLQCQSNAAAVTKNYMLPEHFLYRYLGIDGLDDFLTRFRFQSSQVHLIAHVPGDHAGRHTTTHISRHKKTFLYGSQRIADILHRLSEESGARNKDRKSKKTMIPWFPARFHDDKNDRLVMQPTSLGGYWTRDTLSHLARQYFGLDDEDSVDTGYDGSLMHRLSILWPSMSFMGKMRNRMRPKSPDSVTESQSSQASSISGIQSENPEELVQGAFVFLSSKTFNTIDLPCISRMETYEASMEPTAALRPSHFKSFARFLGGDIDRRVGHFGKAKTRFSWFYLTSSCLSRGAQGIPTTNRSLGSDEMSYSNFELGVLFCSRYQGYAQTDRLYCVNPSRCSCKHKTTPLIHLPIPYCVNGVPYQTDADANHLCMTPYMHDIDEETAYTGHMKLTPMGSKFATDVGDSIGSRPDL